MSWGAIIAAAAPGLLGAIGAAKQNEAQETMAKDQMAFQERMSSTAHQREVDDLRKAGLNPVLSSNQGSSSPQGAMAGIQNEMSGVQGAITSAMEAQKLAKDIEMADQNIKLQKAQTNKANMETKVMSKDLPKADLMNTVYDSILKPFVDAVKGFPNQSNVKDRKDFSNKMEEKSSKTIKDNLYKWRIP